MFHNKLVKTLTDTATLTRLAAGIGWVARKVIKEPMVVANNVLVRNILIDLSFFPSSVLYRC